MQSQRGASSLLILVMLVSFVIVVASSVRYIALQSHQTVDQEQEEQAFGLSDSGVSYTKWLLTPLPNGAGYTPEQLISNPPASAIDHEVYDENDELVGTFSIEFLEADDVKGYLDIRTTGIDRVKRNLCQVIEARLENFSNAGYQTTRWDHLTGYPCPTAINDCTPYPIQLDQTVFGELTEMDCDDQYVDGVNSRADLYTWENTSGNNKVQVNLTTGIGSFIPYLTFRDPDGGDIVLQPNQDGWLVPVAWAGTDQCDAGGACIKTNGNGVVVNKSGTYQIEVAWNGQGVTELGAYTLAFLDAQGEPPAECNDGVNNDTDQLVDANDPGCHTDGDANNPQSYDPNDSSELGTTQCDDGLDNDADGNIDMDDSDCTDPTDNFEGSSSSF